RGRGHRRRRARSPVKLPVDRPRARGGGPGAAGAARGGGGRTLRPGPPRRGVGPPPRGEPTPAFCFARTGSCEIEAGGKKLVGSAQRRYGRTFVQHRSILLGVDALRLPAIFLRTRHALATLTTLEAALGHRPKFDDVATVL